jgi:ABC-type phosphate transport system substrate-binding protein
MARLVDRWLMIGISATWLLGVSNRPARGGAPEQNELDAFGQTLAIIVNTTNPVDSLSRLELRKVFLGERSHWPNGRRITLVMMEPGQAERKTLIRQVCQMSETDFREHFLHGLFTGELISPKTLSSPVGVRKFVFNVPGAIGYVRAADVDSSVKVLRVDGRLPENKEYNLRILPPAAVR